MKITYEGKAYELDLVDLDLKSAVVITGYMGMSLRQWGESLQDDMEEDGETVRLLAIDKPEFLKSLGAVFWLMKYQAGEACPIADVNFKLGSFGEAFMAAMTAEILAAAEAEAAQRAEGEPDPTPPAGSEPSPEPASLTELVSTDGGETADG